MSHKKVKTPGRKHKYGRRPKCDEAMQDNAEKSAGPSSTERRRTQDCACNGLPHSKGVDAARPVENCHANSIK